MEPKAFFIKENKNLQQLKSYFEKAYGRQLSEKELAEITNNLLGFFEFIIKFSEENE